MEGNNILCLPNEHAVELVENQIAKQAEKAKENVDSSVV
jgi:hypothetical protein